jgi:y4mF family transcriptional regulator
MSLPRETDAARLLREIRDREALLKEIDPTGPIKRIPSPLIDIQATVDKLKQPLFQDAIRKIQDLPGRQAIELARQLTRAATPNAIPAPTTIDVVASAAISSVSDLGTLIRRSRKGMKLTQAEFADHAGVGRRFVSELESGKGSLEIEKVLACASAAGIDITARSRAS